MSSEARREQLLDAALAIIVRDGYGAVSIESVAREVDVTRPVIYNVFDDLSALLRALLERQEQRALAQLLQKMSPNPDLADFTGFLQRTFEDLAVMVAEDPTTWQPIFGAHAGTPRVVRDHIAAAREVVRKQIQALIEAGIAAGGGTPGVDPALVSHALVGIGEYFGRLILEAPDSVDPGLLASTVVAMLAPVTP